jgi:hypothetical protein
VKRRKLSFQPSLWTPLAILTMGKLLSWIFSRTFKKRRPASSSFQQRKRKWQARYSLKDRKGRVVILELKVAETAAEMARK